MADELLPLFQSIGLSEQKAKETIKNDKVSKSLQAVILEVRTVHILAEFCQLLWKYEGEIWPDKFHVLTCLGLDSMMQRHCQS